MAIRRASVGGPEFASILKDVTEKVEHLESKSWDFSALPEVFAKDNAADVVAKDLVHIFDGKRMTRLGRLVMAGVGNQFNLMGPIPSDSRIQITDSTVIDEVHNQLGSKGLYDLVEFEKLDPIQRVEFFNYGVFYTLRQMVEWLLVHDAGCFPTTLEHMVRNFAAGNIVQNYSYAPTFPSKDLARPAVMQARCMSLSFPTTAIEWMDKPLYGGLRKDTIHVETLLTTTPTTVSHPYLDLQAEGELFLFGQHYYMRRFAGVAQKQAVRGPGVDEEKAS
ncbi:MAG: hypothetical protein GKS06_11205 [Acidobacteria bacterium]|nr:hypothetical protein [Acidobacteriota bacterium]